MISNEITSMQNKKDTPVNRHELKFHTRFLWHKQVMQSTLINNISLNKNRVEETVHLLSYQKQIIRNFSDGCIAVITGKNTLLSYRPVKQTIIIFVDINFYN